jgi:hypothetical protein
LVWSSCALWVAGGAIPTAVDPAPQPRRWLEKPKVTEAADLVSARVAARAETGRAEAVAERIRLRALPVT